jgi:hypothetical protein
LDTESTCNRSVEKQLTPRAKAGSTNLRLHVEGYI